VIEIPQGAVMDSLNDKGIMHWQWHDVLAKEPEHYGFCDVGINAHQGHASIREEGVGDCHVMHLDCAHDAGYAVSIETGRDCAIPG
jgi:hypothetical protein